MGETLYFVRKREIGWPVMYLCPGRCAWTCDKDAAEPFKSKAVATHEAYRFGVQRFVHIEVVEASQ